MTPREDFELLTARRHGAPARIVPASEPAPAKPARKKAQRKQTEPAKPARKKAQRKQQAEPVTPARIEPAQPQQAEPAQSVQIADLQTKIDPRAQYYTVLTRDSGRTAFIFWWDFQHWLTFNSDGKLQDIRYLGTGKTWEEAHAIAQREAPGKKIVNRYCPRTASWF